MPAEHLATWDDRVRWAAGCARKWPRERWLVQVWTVAGWLCCAWWCLLGAPLPSWDDLVLVRALAWDDDVRVLQELPALTGPNAEPWISIPGVEVLHLRRYLPIQAEA